MAARERGNAILLTVVASLLWGTSFPGTKWGLGYVGNDVFFLWLRFLIATAVTLSVVLFFRKMSLSIFRNPVIWLIGAFNAGGFLMQYVGLTITTASKTSLLVDINVVAVAIISFFVFRERLGKLQVSGIMLGCLGILLLTLNDELVFDVNQLPGDIIVFMAGWSWAFFIVLNKKLLDKHTGIELSSAAIVTCLVWLTLPTGYLFLTGADFSVQTNGWAAIVYLGLACTSAAILLWALGLEGVSATASATIMLIEVLTALAISFTLLNETMSAAAALGAALVLAAIYLVAATGSGEKEELKSA
jgi:drug/metabolite transporter (DMT)-like permease